VGLIAAALFMIEGGLLTDLIGHRAAVGSTSCRRCSIPAPDATIPVRGAD
jgi:hypothetical protein